MTMPGAGRYMATVVGVHGAVVAMHAGAHHALGLTQPLWQALFIALVIVLGPPVALGLWRLRRYRAGAWLLLGTMAAALLFGAYFHFVETGPDHMGFVPDTGVGWLFRISAVLLTITEAWGCRAGLRLARAVPRPPSRTSAPFPGPPP
ncbi:MAG: hypothetical protein D6746_09915 [Bacteroidetes bacterium]|nr:MAG: hypothetical protein D6746_09915 [Bacteroidota bacterium]